MNTPSPTETKVQIPTGYVQDRDGHLVPRNKVKPIDMDRDKLVKKLIRDAKKLSGTLAEFREDGFDQIAKFADKSAAQYGAKMGGRKGNMTLHSYDGTYKIVLNKAEFKTFDERLQTAKSLIDECIHIWAKGANKNLQALVDHAFETDKAGHVSVSKILGLRRINIDDERWANAMTAIADSIQSTGSKRYLRFYERIGESEEYRPISLDAANA